MTINSGELIGLIGPNGAGKTTVFNLLTGVYQPTEGEFFLDGERMNGKKTYQVVRAGIARTFQNIRLENIVPYSDFFKLEAKPQCMTARIREYVLAFGKGLAARLGRLKNQHA